jgi:hypothetical protein
MSLFPEIVDSLNHLQRQINASKQHPASIILRMPETTLTPNSNALQLIHVDTEQLPSITEVTMFPNSSNERMFMGHIVNNDFVYEPTHSSNDGIKSDFHLIGDPGMFLVGPRYYITNVEGSVPNFKTVIDNMVSANGTDIGELPIILTGNQKEHIFLARGDNFRVRYDPTLNEGYNSDIEIAPFSEFTITRISRNADYISPFVYMVG